MTSPKFYTYLWLRKNETPYYVGKGKGDRAFDWHGRHINRPKDKSRIILFSMESEAHAFESEKALIELFGRQDIGTGILRNMTDGGDGASGARHREEWKCQLREKWRGRSIRGTGWHHTEESKQRLSAALRGSNSPRFGKPGTNVGRKFSAEHCRRISEARMGHSTSEETRRKISATKTGRRICEEQSSLHF